MNKQELLKQISAAGLEYLLEHPLSEFTTWKVGGPAEILVKVSNSEELEKISKIAIEQNIEFITLGWGSNVLISDNGLRGLVIINRSNTVDILDEDNHNKVVIPEIAPRLEQVDTKNYYSISDLEYDESDSPEKVIIVDSGVYLPYLINHLISKGITGLQWFAGIPGTIGGAIYNNIHGGNHFFSTYVLEVEALTRKLEKKIYTPEELSFDYDYSIFHTNQDIILRAKLKLYLGDKERARNTSIAWATKKKLQPANSAGCCFQNIDKDTQIRLKLESNSWGYIIDQILGLKNTQIGGAKISPYHAAFIETESGAKASDILELFNIIYSKSKEKLGIVPKPEIFFLGFTPEEISNLT
ncbi:FAD-binding protein [Candidatus Dojkabacteria bacterium]|uniref:UDP-N-acetylenolpyruvoylglucosamine reductase n=1 Tax=Candidatus Dojkabacteria bacterium TaxID=2099670 RepID=A0A955L782_9BACT|nr:FAD-binding protein [Candidatus Dojkabacteria bacterium]